MSDTAGSAEQPDWMNSLLNKLIQKTLTGDGASDRHLMTLFAVTLQLRATSVLELGVWHGATTEPLLAACALTRGRLTAVDNQPTTYVAPPELAAYYRFVQMDSLAFLANASTAGDRFDLILVDDWHAYDHVRRELALIEKISDPTTVILMHDLMADRAPHYSQPSSAKYDGTEWEGGGPFRAVQELDKDKYEWATIPVCNGLTLLRQRSPVDVC